MKEIIPIDEEIELSFPSLKDVPALVRILGDREIYERTIMIPFPYSEKDGNEFIELCSQRRVEFGHPVDWGIYKKEEGLIGMIGFYGTSKQNPEVDGIGYWLAKPYWGRGIMTKVLQKITELGFEKYGFNRLEMPIFSFNRPSCRVAEKCGYRHEKDLPAAYQKDGKPIDARLYVIDQKLKPVTFIVLDLSEPFAAKVRCIRKKYDQGLDSFPAEITVAGSSGVGTLASGQEPDEVFAVLDEIAASQAPIKARFEGILRFPGTHLFYLALANPQPFIRLHERIAGSGLKFNATPYPYTPHCTLAGLKGTNKGELALIQSEIYPKGTFLLNTLSVYEVRKERCLLLHRTELSGK